jgi:hypothetical protein
MPALKADLALRISVYRAAEDVDSVPSAYHAEADTLKAS